MFDIMRMIFLQMDRISWFIGTNTFLMGLVVKVKQAHGKKS